MTTNKIYSSVITEAEDGSGDGILTFPDELIAETGWKPGQKLKLSVEDGCLIITEVTEKQQKD